MLLQLVRGFVHSKCHSKKNSDVNKPQLNENVRKNS